VHSVDLSGHLILLVKILTCLNERELARQYGPALT